MKYLVVTLLMFSFLKLQANECEKYYKVKYFIEYGFDCAEQEADSITIDDPNYHYKMGRYSAFLHMADFIRLLEGQERLMWDD